MSTCPECGSWQSAVKESRKDTRWGYKWRLRDCQNCQHRWATYEVPVDCMEINDAPHPSGKLIR